MLAPSGAPHIQTRIKRATRGLRKLKAANAGNYEAFESMLDLAYGRKGKLKWELLQPILTDPGTPLPPRIIPQVENSRPPVYTKPLIALLTTAQSMATRPLKKGVWTPAKLLPSRANECSEEAHIFGPFSKRREYNMQQKFFRTEKAKVRPPLETTIALAPQDEPANPGDTRPLPFQKLGLLSDIERLVGTAGPPPLTRKERKAANATNEIGGNTDPPSPPRHPSRWVRRRYRALLAKVPVLTYTPKPGQTDGGTYSVRLSDRAAGQSTSASASNVALREIDDVNLAWLRLGMEENTSTENYTKKTKDKSSKNDNNAGEEVQDE
ncbi:hypothetical protein MD484_g1170, partial [Candolleomyces efflorescens]